MGLVDRLDALDAWTRDRLPASWRPTGSTPTEQQRRMICGACRFFQRHTAVFVIVMALEVFLVVGAVASLIIAPTNADAVRRAGQVVAGITGVGLWLFLRRGRPRFAVIAALTGGLANFGSDVGWALLRHRDAAAVFAATATLFFLGSLWLLPRRTDARC